MQLNLTSDPMIHNAGGRLVIDVARPDPQTVTFSSILEQLPKPDGLRLLTDALWALI